MVNAQRLAAAIQSGQLSDPVSSLLDPEMVHAHPDHPSETVLERLAQSHGVLPIVSREDAQRVLGVVTFPQIMQFMRTRRAGRRDTVRIGERSRSGSLSHLTDAMTEGPRNKTRGFYDRISRGYDLIADSSEHAVRDLGVRALGVSHGQRVLEIGCGTGHGLVSLANAVGKTGQVHGVDIS